MVRREAELLGGLEVVETNGPRRRWRLRSLDLHRLVTVSAEELAGIEAAVRTIERTGQEERASLLRRTGEKLRAGVRPLGLLYGSRAFLVASSGRRESNRFR